MSNVAQKSRNAAAKSKSVARKPKTKSATAARKPAYVQAKLGVSKPGDQAEQEADRVAEEVSRTPRPGNISRLSIQRMETESAVTPEAEEEVATKAVPAARSIQRQAEEEEEEEELQTKLYRQPEEEEELQTKLYRQAEEEEEEEIQAKLFRQPEEEEEAVQVKLHRQAGEGNEDQSQTDPETATVAGHHVDKQTEQRIENLRGTGQSLPEDVLKDMEARFGRRFRSVGIHTDGEAAALCAKLNARAFTVGNDIFFAPGEFSPETEQGRKLLAHELTHVVQQSGCVARIQRRIDPAPSPAHAVGSESQRKLDVLSQLKLPAIKQRHAPLYGNLANEGNLKRIRGYSRGRTAQVSEWRRNVVVREEAAREKLSRISPPIELPDRPRDAVNDLKIGGEPYVGTKQNLLNNKLRIPTWDRAGNQNIRYQVDHIVELQISGQRGTRSSVGNSIQNMELLDQPSNSSSGSTIMNRIYDDVANYLATLTNPPSRRDWLRTHDIIFDSVAISSRGGPESESSWWSKADIEEAEPLANAEKYEPEELQGDSTHFVLASGAGGVEIERFRHRASQTNITPNRRAAKSLAGLEITEINLNGNVGQCNAGDVIGSVTATWDLPTLWSTPDQPIIPLVAISPYVGYLNPLPGVTPEFAPTSPSSFQDIEITSAGLYAEGSMTPSLPLLSGVEVRTILSGSDIELRAEYSPENINLNLPGVEIDDALVVLAYSARDGFGASGTIYFGVPNAGDGNLTIGVSQSGGFEAEGNFNFDSELFDRAEISIWYRDRQFGGEGTIGIDSPDKIKGVRSASLTIGFGENEFSAEGDVQPNIPGVQQAALSVNYDEETGLTIGGSLDLSADTPGIESGSIEVTLNKQDGAWKVSASGTAVPSIPGINSELTINYNDGAFTAEVTADYSRGMLSGQVNAGVTNRTVGEDGELTDTANPDNPLIVYGGGSLTIQIAPWLQGTAGVQFAPNGEINVTGEIGLPGELEIFPRSEINKSIFNIAVQIPIIPGILAEIGGGLSAQAGIGPGVIDELRLGIEYNPAREEDTRVTGDAHLNIPADAGLRLSVRAGIGLGVTGLSATGGLEIGGTLGIEGAAEAGVHVDWTPGAGLDLTADLAVHAQPSFKFDISGYVSVRALGFSVYDERWELASFQFGSDLRFGIRMPIHYHEGEPFNVSLDDVEFEVPDIDTSEMLRGLISRIA